MMQFKEKKKLYKKLCTFFKIPVQIILTKNFQEWSIHSSFQVNSRCIIYIHSD